MTDQIATGPAEEQPRLSAQCRGMLALLIENGRVTNREFASVALKYTSRVSDLRKAGFNVRVVDRSRETGLTTYELASN